MSSDNPIQKHPESQAGNGAADQLGGQPNPEGFPVGGPTEPNSPQSPNDRKYPARDRDWHDYAMLIIEGVGVVFLIAYTTFAALQWRAMRESNHQAKHNDISNCA